MVAGRSTLRVLASNVVIPSPSFSRNAFEDLHHDTSHLEVKYLPVLAPYNVQDLILVVGVRLLDLVQRLAARTYTGEET